MSAPPAAAAAAAAESVTTAIRRVLLLNGNKAMRLASLFEAVSPSFPAMTRTHFRAKVVRQMFDRGEVLKYLVTEEVRGRPRTVYGMRLKNNRAARDRAAELGLYLRKGGGGAGAVVDGADEGNGEALLNEAAAAAAAAPAAGGDAAALR